MRGRSSKGAKFARAYGSLSVGSMLAVALLTSCGSSSNGSSGQAARTAAGFGAAGRAGTVAGLQASGRSRALRPSKPAKLPSGTVAKVDGIPVTLAAYTHQLQISAQGPVKPLIANASDYPACMAALKKREERNRKLAQQEEEKYAKRFKGRKSPGFVQRRKPVGSTQRKRQCEQLYKFASQQAVSNLIRRIWAQTQAKELGVIVSESEVESQVKAREAGQKAFAKNARYRELEAEVPHYNKAELMEMVKSQLLQSKVFTKIREKFSKRSSPGSQGQLQGMFKYNEEIRVKQREKTECAAGYLTPLCK